MPRVSNKQSQYSITIDLSMIPTNAFSLRGDAFYSLVEELTSKDVEDLLKIQKISNARCFLNTNSLDFFDIHSDDPFIVDLQDRLSIKTLNKKRTVLAGVQGYLHYLQQLLNSFLIAQRNKRIKSNNSTDANSHPHQVPSTPMPITPLSINSSTTAALFHPEHRHFLNEKIKSWWEKHRDQFNLGSDALTEPDDYQIVFNNKSAVIKCRCNQTINIPIPKGRKHCQLSNFYKHLTQSSQCAAAKRKRASTELDDDTDLDISFSPSSSVDAAGGSDTQTTTEDGRQSTELNSNPTESDFK
ncbi:unnamed protein product [Adineta ricciae]|uniref:Uncharacterized protein n=1 Tax=Adineta ricciae TaxID=249248 RepID=A0A815MSF3_ADIRI|nr:unnamed protein product [Adineta ricciae]CAF1426964.1 unnamed protein product [Adineta ricciae]